MALTEHDSWPAPAASSGPGRTYNGHATGSIVLKINRRVQEYFESIVVEHQLHLIIFILIGSNCHVYVMYKIKYVYIHT